uniref:Uncharacterized protein n=1 Tax=Anguilla anguilla TaxID=7936 RepID=A0A0E9TF26_ANGAN
MHLHSYILCMHYVYLDYDVESLKFREKNVLTCVPFCRSC